MVFDPWASNFEAAKLANDEAIKAGKELADPCNPFFQWNAACSVNAYRTAIDGGDGFAVLACIRKCVTHGLIAPEWLAYAFNRRYDAVLNCRANSWDSSFAFGRPYPKGKHLHALRTARENSVAVWNAVAETMQKEPATPIDKGLFEVIGKSLNMGATLTEELYYKAKRIMWPCGVEKNPAKKKNFTGI